MEARAYVLMASYAPDNVNISDRYSDARDDETDCVNPEEDMYTVLSV